MAIYKYTCGCMTTMCNNMIFTVYAHTVDEAIKSILLSLEDQDMVDDNLPSFGESIDDSGSTYERPTLATMVKTNNEDQFMSLSSFITSSHMMCELASVTVTQY